LTQDTWLSLSRSLSLSHDVMRIDERQVPAEERHFAKDLVFTENGSLLSVAFDTKSSRFDPSDEASSESRAIATNEREREREREYGLPVQVVVLFVLNQDRIASCHRYDLGVGQQRVPLLDRQWLGTLKDAVVRDALWEEFLVDATDARVSQSQRRWCERRIERTSTA